MTEHYRFFDSSDPSNPDRSYNAQEFTDYFKALVTTGVMKGVLNELKVTTTGSNMQTIVDTGIAFVDGRYYENDSSLVLTHDTEVLGVNRIDRVVIRLDLTTENRFVKAFIKKGSPGTTPNDPPLTREGNIYEISLAQVLIVGGQTYIEAADITDERGDEYYCPWAGSNILPNFNDDTLAELTASVEDLEATAVRTDTRTEIWVDSTVGSDTTGDGTINNPYQTLGYTMEQVKKVQIKNIEICVQPGNYSGFNTNNHVGGTIEISSRDRATGNKIATQINIQGSVVINDSSANFNIFNLTIQADSTKAGVIINDCSGKYALNSVNVSEVYDPYSLSPNFDGIEASGSCVVSLSYCDFSNCNSAIVARNGAIIEDTNTTGTNNDICFESNAAIIFNPSSLIEGAILQDISNGGQIFDN